MMLSLFSVLGRKRVIATLAILTLAGLLFPDEPPPSKLWVYVGTYTSKKSQGIYRCELDLASGELTLRGLAAETTNPSFLAIHPSHRYLYAVGEVASLDGRKGGGVSAFAIHAGTGKLTLLNQHLSGGAGPCHVAVDREGRNVLVANYGGGSAAVLPIQRDGRLSEASAVVQHQGKSVNPRRQEAPHAHSINLDSGNRFAFVADLGLDKVMIYRFDAAQGRLTANQPPAAQVLPGAGPRHFAFHPSGRSAYVINELHNTVTVFGYDAEPGVLKELQTLSTLPKEFRGTSYTAEVQVHPSGKFLYGSNRGHNSIAIFSVDSGTGKLALIGHQANGIQTPRNFAIDPTGRYLLVANQDADSLIVFRIDSRNGELQPVGGGVKIPSPVCVKMMPAPR